MQEDSRNESPSDLDIAARRAAMTAEIVDRTGINNEMIERLVLAFYEKVRRDSLLAPIFEERVTNWPQHLQRMCAFWSSVALMSGIYHGRPMAKHMPLPVDAEHFDRWLTMFEETAFEVCPPAAAEHFVLRARTIAKSLEAGIAMHIGADLPLGARLHRADIRLGTDSRREEGKTGVGS